MLKRTFDILAAASLLLVALPVLGVVALAVCCTIGTPVLFRQQRPGYLGKPFIIYKFRTMSEKRDRNGNLSPDSERLGIVGRFLRKTSLDELPEFYNILRGEMSLVGPRPLLMSYITIYTPEQARRHDVLPGITGWAQIHGRNETPWEDQFKMDVWYVDHHSFALDLKILWITAWLVLSGKGVNEPGHATRTEFTGKIV